MKLPRWFTWDAHKKASLRVEVGLALAHGQDEHRCPRCRTKFRRRVFPGCHGLSSREMEIVDLASDFTMRRLAASRIARFILRIVAGA